MVDHEKKIRPNKKGPMKNAIDQCKVLILSKF